MWQLIDIESAKYLSYCDYKANKFQYVLCDCTGSQAYSEIVEDNELIKRIASLNKRIRYPDAIVRDTIIQEEPTQAIIDEQSEEANCTLKLTYRINGSPMVCKWHLQRMDNPRLWIKLLTPLLQTVVDLSTQINTLRECVIKKDAEIQQYKIEGAQLRRSTIATQPFDTSRLDELHKMVQKQTKQYQIITDHLIKSITSDGLNKEMETTAIMATNIKEDSTNNEKQVLKYSKSASPKSQKRKASHFGNVHIKRKVMQRRRAPQLEYKDSQSQSDDQGEEISEGLATVENQNEY